MYEKEEGAEMGEMDGKERKEGEEGRIETLEPPMSRTRPQRKKNEETRKRLLDETDNDMWALVDEFNAHVGANEKKANSTNKVPERAKPSGVWTKGTFVCWCCPHAFSHEVNCMFAWCKKCYQEMETNRDVGRPDKKGRHRRTRVNDLSTEVVGNLRGNCEKGHTMEDMKYLVSNDDHNYLKRNKNKVWPLIVDRC